MGQLTCKQIGNQSSDSMQPIEEWAPGMVGRAPNKGIEGLANGENDGKKAKLNKLEIG
jgi:hypothetical protein